MCGIAGLASLSGKPVPPEAIKRMTDAISHRGPDDAGYAFFRVGDSSTGRGGYWTQFADERFRHLNESMPVFGGAYFKDEIAKSPFSVVLGHRRLAIIDLTHWGHQPMASSNHRFWVTFNGEIYNFKELRQDLEAKGYLFRSASDTEVVLHLWEEYGEAGLSRLDGMFAFALFDTEKNELVLVRDRFGVKPVYYATGNDYFLFGSETKAILASGLHRAEIDPGALGEYFTFQNIFGTDTLFKGVRILEPGHVLRIRPGPTSDAKSRSYAPEVPPIDPSLAENAKLHETLAETFSAAVTRQLVSDVEIGSYLSGGMDSGSIVAVAGRSIPRLLTFTAGFDLRNVNGIEQGFDERRAAEKLAYLLQTEHYDVVLHAGDMPAAMSKIGWHMDDPRVGMCHQNWYVAKLASKFVKVCLAGAGGDELFGGYPWRYRAAFESKGAEDFDEAYLRYWFRLLPPEELPHLFAPGAGFDPERSRASFYHVMASAPKVDRTLSSAENLVQRALHFEYRTFLHGFLVTEDHISMAHSLETRVPFLDNALADLAFRMPPSFKVATGTLAKKAQGEGHLESADGKKILRKAMEAFLPREFTQQKKQGFSPPDENWYRGPSMDYLRGILLDKRTLERPWFRQDFVRARIDEHFEGKRNHRLLIWSLLSFEWLQRHFIDAA